VGSEISDRTQALLNGYGPADTDALIETILWWQTRAADGIDSEAAAGVPAMTRLVKLGVPDDIRQARTWISTNYAVLAAELGQGGVG
jgi:hypothetical protein